MPDTQNAVFSTEKKRLGGARD